MRGLGIQRQALLRLLGEVAIVVGAYMAYEVVRRLVAPNSHDAFGHAFSIIKVEQELGIFVEPTLQSLIVDHHWLVTLFNWSTTPSLLRSAVRPAPL